MRPHPPPLQNGGKGLKNLEKDLLRRDKKMILEGDCIMRGGGINFGG